MDNKETAKHLKALIANNQHSEAIEEMLKLLESTGGEGEDGLFVLLGRKNRLDDQLLKNTISKDNADLEFNRITDTLLTYANKIGKGEKTTFAVSSPSKEIVEHDKKIINELFKIIDYSYLDKLKTHVTESYSIPYRAFSKFHSFQQFLANPENELLLISIHSKANLVVESMNLFSKATWSRVSPKLEGEANLIFFYKYVLTLAVGGIDSSNSFKLQDEDKRKLSIDALDDIIISYKDFRKEIKQKLFI